jgi:hypothetical protein
MSLKIPQIFSKKLNGAQIQKVIDVCKAVKITHPVHLLAVMYFESARTFSPSVTNSIGSVGLIQFTRDKAGVQYKTIRGKKYLLSDLKKMTFLEQMDVVAEYYKEAAGGKTLSTFIDVYLVTFFPRALGKEDSYVLQTAGLSASLIAKQNPAFDTNKDSQIRKSEVVEYFRRLYKQLGVDFDSEINIGAKTGLGLVGIALVLFCYTGYACGCLAGLC